MQWTFLPADKMCEYGLDSAVSLWGPVDMVINLQGVGKARNSLISCDY